MRPPNGILAPGETVMALGMVIFGPTFFVIMYICYHEHIGKGYQDWFAHMLRRACSCEIYRTTWAKPREEVQGQVQDSELESETRRRVRSRAGMYKFCEALISRVSLLKWPLVGTLVRGAKRFCGCGTGSSSGVLRSEWPISSKFSQFLCMSKLLASVLDVMQSLHLEQCVLVGNWKAKEATGWSRSSSAGTEKAPWG